MIPNVSHESRTNSTRAHPKPGTPDGVPWARCPWPSVGHVSALPGVAEFSWFQLRVLWAFKTSCAAIEMTPQKREHMQPWVFEAYSLYILYLYFLFTDSYDASYFRVTPNQWHVRFKSSSRQIQPKPPVLPQASQCQNLPNGSLPPRSYLLWINNLILGMIQKLSFTGGVHI